MKATLLVGKRNDNIPNQTKTVKTGNVSTKEDILDKDGNKVLSDKRFSSYAIVQDKSQPLTIGGNYGSITIVTDAKKPSPPPFLQIVISEIQPDVYSAAMTDAILNNSK
jgi:hypothetical protein